MRFLRSVRGYSSLDKISDYDVRPELILSKLKEKT
jgi:hypothetical protein